MGGKCLAAKYTTKQEREEGCGEEEPLRMPHFGPDTASGTLDTGGWEAGSGPGQNLPEMRGNGAGVSLISSRWVSLSDGAGWQTKIGPAVAVVGVSIEV